MQAAANFQGLQDEVAKLCLEWWQAEAVGREMLTPQAVPYLFVKAIATGECMRGTGGWVGAIQQSAELQ